MTDRRKKKRRARPSESINARDAARAGAKYDLEIARALQKWTGRIPPAGASTDKRKAWWLSFTAPLRQRVRELAQRLAADFGADATKIESIVYSRGDLQSYIPRLIGEERRHEQDLRAARAACKIYGTLAKLEWPFDDKWIGDRRHPLTSDALEVALLGKQITPPIGEKRGKRYVWCQGKSQKEWAKVLNAAEQTVLRRLDDAEAAARRKLAEFKAGRRAIGLHQGPFSPSFQRAPVIRDLATDLYSYLAASMFRKQYPARSSSGLSPQRIAKSLEKPIQGKLVRASVDFVNTAFPSVSRLKPALLWAHLHSEGW